jgi:hypothetical protein
MFSRINQARGSLGPTDNHHTDTGINSDQQNLAPQAVQVDSSTASAEPLSKYLARRDELSNAEQPSANNDVATEINSRTSRWNKAKSTAANNKLIEFWKDQQSIDQSLSSLSDENPESIKANQGEIDAEKAHLADLRANMDALLNDSTKANSSSGRTERKRLKDEIDKSVSKLRDLMTQPITTNNISESSDSSESADSGDSSDSGGNDSGDSSSDSASDCD